MKKFLNNIQSTYNYTDYQIEVIKYFFLTIASEFSKLLIIFTFFICTGKFIECFISLVALLFLRLSCGGYHCEHYITCFLFSFSYIYASIFLAEHIHPARLFIISVMILSIFVAYKLAPMISKHRLEPSKDLIKRSKIFNICFLFISLLAVSTFYTNQYLLIVFWVCTIHTIQLLLAKLQKGGNYYVTGVHESCV